MNNNQHQSTNIPHNSFFDIILNQNLYVSHCSVYIFNLHLHYTTYVPWTLIQWTLHTIQICKKPPEKRLETLAHRNVVWGIWAEATVGPRSPVVIQPILRWFPAPLGGILKTLINQFAEQFGQRLCFLCYFIQHTFTSRSVLHALFHIL
jgi:hypothetical protein